MSTQRLTFLYPALFRPAAAAAAAAAARGTRTTTTTTSSSRRGRRRPNVAHFGTSTASSFGPRVGKGIEPKPLGDVQPAPSLESHMKGQAGVATTTTPTTTAAAATAAAGAGAAAAIPLPPPDQRDSTPEQRKDAAIALDPSADSVKETLSSPGVSSAANKKKQEEDDAAAAAAATSGSQEDGAGGPKKKRATGPMDAVLHMEPPENAKPEDKPPHLTPPPYVHHFDSYSLVKQLEGGGYTQDQAITAMKAVRTLLAHNLDVAQGGLISKSDVENETYLFRAACAELSTEVKNNRRIADEQLRQQRTILQHEVDNTSQALNQELLVLNDNVRGMFNDRKMAVREEQKKAEGTIQQVAYKISVTLNSDSKSQIEAVRWVLARRAVLGIVFMVVLSLGMLRYGSYVSHESKREAQREREESEALRRAAGKVDAAPSPDAAAMLAAN